MTDTLPTKIPSTIFSCSAKGDYIRPKILKNCIVCLGLTRVGKSTLFNWICGKQLIGRRVYGRVVYENIDPDGATISASALSETLIPNIYKISDELCYIDTAGFKDKRNHVGVFGVCYMLKMLFEAGTNFKFLIVVSKDHI